MTKSRRHLFRRHRWSVVAVDWNLLRPDTLATAVCLLGCRKRKSVEYPGANLTKAAIVPVFPRRSWR